LQISTPLPPPGRVEAPAFIRWLKHSGYIRDYICVPDADLPNAEGKYEPDEGRLSTRLSSLADTRKTEIAASFGFAAKLLIERITNQL
jgi:hypothetical protein